MKALVLSAYDARSHQLWRENLYGMFPQIHWSELILPPRYYSWRVRGNSLSWAFNHRDTLTDNYDFILSTSMTDLSALRGFVPQLGSVPTAIYFHENQFAYPDNPAAAAQHRGSVEPQLLSIYTALCADEVIFNSQYNKSSFLAGAKRLLRKLPDHVPQGLVQSLESASVIPVPLTPALFTTRSRTLANTSPTLDIVWNHRWEFDKGPALLLAIVQLLVNQGTEFRLHVLGQRFRQCPEEFTTIAQLLKSHYQQLGITPGHWGFIESRADYDALLCESDVVLSTATHDFQGLAVLEACAQGCAPLAPHCMAYPEYLAAQNLYPLNADVQASAAHAVDTLVQWAKDKRAQRVLPLIDATQFSPHALRSAYSSLFHRLCNTTRD